MFYVAGKIAYKSIPPTYGVVEKGMIDPYSDAFKESIAVNYGGSSADYSLFTASDNSTEAIRVMRGDDWVPTWTGDVITAIDFSTEDAKKWIQISTDKNSILSDGVEKVIFIVSVLTANKSEVDSTFEGTVDIPMSVNHIGSKLRFYFFKGKSSREYSSIVSGKLVIPSDRVPGYRVNNLVTIDMVQ